MNSQRCLIPKPGAAREGPRSPGGVRKVGHFLPLPLPPPQLARGIPLESTSHPAPQAPVAGSELGEERDVAPVAVSGEAGPALTPPG